MIRWGGVMTPPTHRKFAQSMMVADGEEAGSRWFARAIIRPGRRGQKAPYRVKSIFRETKKPPEPYGSRGESMIRGTPLVASRGEAASGSDKPYLCNGRTRVPLLEAPLRLRDRLRNQTSGPSAPVHTDHRLSEASRQGGFFLRCLYTIYN